LPSEVVHYTLRYCYGGTQAITPQCGSPAGGDTLSLAHASLLLKNLDYLGLAGPNDEGIIAALCSILDTILDSEGGYRNSVDIWLLAWSLGLEALQTHARKIIEANRKALTDQIKVLDSNIQDLLGL